MWCQILSMMGISRNRKRERDLKGEENMKGDRHTAPNMAGAKMKGGIENFIV